MFKFQNLEVWKRSTELYGAILETSDAISRKDQYSLGDQVRRAALSVSTNIAEGTGREGEKESKYFFNIAKGSVYEVVSLLYVMKDKGYILIPNYDGLYTRCDEIAMMLTGLLRK